MRITAGLHRAWTSGLVALTILFGGTAFGQPPPQGSFEPDLLQVSVNGQPFDTPFLLLHGPGGRLYASAAALRAWRLRPPGAPATTFDGEAYYPLDQLPGLRVTISPQDQSAAIQADPAAFDRTRVDLDGNDAGAITPSATGLFLNYDLFAEWLRDRPSLNGVIDGGLFTRHGVGTASMIAYSGRDRTQIVRLETSWTIDRPDSMTVLRLGDSVSEAAVGAYPVRFAGVQFSRNFAAQPGFVTMPLPTFSGAAAVPSVVDVYVNNTLQQSRDVNAGPFELTHIPVLSGGGNVQLVMRDLLGREVTTEFGYYTSSALLRRGLHDFSYEIGFLRRDFSLRSNAYGAPIAMTTQRYGVSNSLTVEGHAQVSGAIQMGGAGLVYDLARVGLITASAAASHSSAGTGADFSFGFERRTLGLSLGVQAQYSQANFRFNGAPTGIERPRLTFAFFADLPLRAGSLAANVIHRNYRIAPDETIAALSLNLHIAGSAFASIYTQRTMIGKSRTEVGTSLTFQFGRHRAAGLFAERGPDSSFARASFQQDPPAESGIGYRAAISLGDDRGGEAEIRHNGRFGSYALRVASLNGEAGARLSARGSIGLIGNHLFAAQAIGPSFGLVEVGQPDVRVYADNQLVGVTGKSGALILPQLRAFERNMIRIDDADLPLDLTPDVLENAVRPVADSGVILRFRVRRENGALMRLHLPDGSLLPSGAIVRLAGQDAEFPVAGDGEVYVTGLTRDPARLVASWGDRTCEFRAALPATDDPQPFVDGLVCRPLRLAGN
jgi:outer membrane usher protein